MTRIEPIKKTTCLQNAEMMTDITAWICAQNVFHQLNGCRQQSNHAINLSKIPSRTIYVFLSRVAHKKINRNPSTAKKYPERSGKKLDAQLH
jgi:hypothetical protein